MENFFAGNDLLGFKFSSLNNGSIPITEEKQPLQIVTLKHPAGVHLKAHMHRPIQRITESLQECLIVKKGKIKLDLYDSNKNFIQVIELIVGDIFLLMKGGIGINIVDDAEIIEIKNGPFKEDKILI